MKNIINKNMKFRDTICGDCATCERDRVSEKFFEKLDIEVRYMKNIRGKLSPYTCDQKLCPVMKERLHRHQVEHHAKNRKGSRTTDHGVSIMKFNEDLIVTPIVNPNIENGDEICKATRTDANSNNGDLHNKKINRQNVNLETTDEDDSTTQTGHIPLKTSETIEVLTPNSNFYREYVRNEIHDWIRDVPMYENASAKMRKDNLTNELLENVVKLSSGAQDPSYDSKLKSDIDDCLQKLPLVMPGAKHDQDLFKGNLTENLFNTIKELNIKLLGSQNGSIDTLSANRSTDSINLEVTEWLTGIQLEDSTLTKDNIATLLLNRLRPILDVPTNTTNYKLKMKGEIVGVLNNLPIRLKSAGNKVIYLNRFAEDLANRLLSVLCRRRKHSLHYNIQIEHEKSYDVFGIRHSDSFGLNYNLNNKLKECFKILNIDNDNIVADTTSLLVDNIDLLKSGHENTIKNEIAELIYDTCNFTESQSSSIADYILKSVKGVMDQHVTRTTVINPQLSGIISVYTSEESNLITSTPKRVKKVKPQFTSNETNYTKKIAELVRSWIDILPESNKKLDDKEFKEVAINDLAGNVMDTIKLTQLTKDEKKEEEHILFITNVWILKFNVFDNTDDAQPFIKDFYKKIKNIPVPDLTKSTSGSRNMAKNVEFSEKSDPRMKYFPENLDLIEDQISVWMNEQPSEIYVSNDKKLRSKMIHEVAEKLQVQLKNENSKKEVKTTVSKFLSNIMQSKADLNELSDSLSERITKLPNERYLANERKTQQDFKDHLVEKCCMSEEQDVEFEDANESIKEFVAKYTQHFYDIDDSVARGAFEHLLRVAIMKNDPESRKDIYDRMEKDTTKQFLDRELMYISMVSDWLKNIPVDSSFNTTGNIRRINFINILAKELRGLDEARNEHPDWNYENEFHSIIHGYINLLPLDEKQKQNIPFMINQLQKRVFGFSFHQSLSYNDSMLHENNLGDFIEEYVLIRAQSIADDEVKLDAWMARLMKEIRKMAREDPNALTCANVYHRLEGVPVPTEESVKMFELELIYVKEITEWLRNLPLLPMKDNNDEQTRIDMVSDLAEKLAQRKYSEEGKSDSLQRDTEMCDYITTWISKLPLNSNREVIVPIVTQQLVTRINNVTKKEDTTVTTRRNSVKDNINKRDTLKKATPKKDSIKKSSIDKKKVDTKSKQDITKLNPGQMVVDAVENWLKKLPIDGDEKTVKSIKEDLAKRWFKKVGEINSDPKIFGDDDLYQELLNEEIHAQLEIIPSSNKLGENKDKMKTDFINAILEARKIMKYKSAGDDYVHRLINTLDASIPNPVAYQQINDPGFEIYKNKLANLFILSNFDHCNDDYKIPYEKKIREEVNKYVTHAANRNAIPLTNDQINNELFSVLFKVPFPNEESIVNEVEELKTKIIIDSWYEELPLGEPHNGLIELLERDKILSTLAKRIHELEREGAPAEKVLKEIKKWMGKFPFEIKFACKFDFYATKLLNKLISTKEERKCFVECKKGAKGKEKRNERDNHHTNLSIGPNNKSYNWKNSNVSPCCQLEHFEERNPTELILEMIEVWFEKLPIKANDEELKILKTDAVTKMVLKISELNADPDILYDDMTYYALVNQELDKVLSNLPLCCDFPSTSDYKKSEFMAVLQNIKPLLIDEIARHQYKKELKDTINNLLEPPKGTNEEKSVLFNHFKDELVEEFVQYYYTKGDEKGRQFYKNKVHDTVLKYVQEILNKQQQNVNPLILRNRLICELEKIPIPSEIALKHNVEEIRMKEEVAAFLNENSLTPKNKVQDNVMTSLAKKLFEIERTGHTCDNERKMKAEIFKNTRKLGKELSCDKVDAFLNKLKETEPFRKAPPPRDVESAHQMLKKGNGNNITKWIPIQTDFSSSQAGGCGARYVTSRRQVGPQLPIANSHYSMFQFHEPNYYCGSSHTTNPSLMNIEHLVQDADRWVESHQDNTNRPVRMIPSINNYNTERAPPYSTVDIDPRQIEMQQVTNFHTIEQPILDRGSFQPGGVRSQTLPSESFQVTPHGQTQSQSPPRFEAPPSQLLYGPVNLSCSPCRNPCPLRTSPDQVDPCNTERAYTRNNQIQSNFVQDIDSNFGQTNVSCSKSVPIQPHAALNQSLHEGLHMHRMPLYGQDYQPNSQGLTTPNIPNGSQVQFPQPTILEQSIASAHSSTQPFSCENVDASQVSSCCQNVQPPAAPFMPGGNQVIIPEQSLIGTNIRPQVNVQSNVLPTADSFMHNASHGPIPGQYTVAANTSLQPSSTSVRQGVNLSPCLPSTQRTASGTGVTPAELSTAQMTNNKDDILKGPMTNDAHTQLMRPGQIRRQPPRKKAKLRDAREIPEDGETENGDVVNVLCKCGKRRARRRKYYDDDFEMCFGRLPRCYYY